MPAPGGHQGPAAQSYSRMESVRQPYLQAAYKAASLTIPSLFPDANDASTSDRHRKELPTPWQGLGSRGINNVASKLLLTLFPPSHPSFKYQINPKLTAARSDNADIAKAEQELQEVLAQREVELSDLIESDGLRPSKHEAIRQLLCAGNVLLHLPDQGGMRVFKLNRYVCKRDSFGRIIEGVLKETLAKDALPENVRDWMDEQFPYWSAMPTADGREDEIDLYTHIKIERGGKTYRVYQELLGQKVPGSEGTYPADAPEFIFLRLSRTDGEDYGRGYIEENIGDLISFDALQQAIITFAGNAAEVKWLVDPNGSTEIRPLKNSVSGDFIAGRKKDVEALTLDKFADMRVAESVREDLKSSLSFVFMLNSAVRRNGERVTAEEIREVAREIDSSFGGIYTILSQDFQLNVVKRYERRAEAKRQLVPIPKDAVKPVIVTGLESIGRSQDLDKLHLLLDEIERIAKVDQNIVRYIESEEFLSRIAIALSIKKKGLIRDKAEVQAEIQQETQAARRQELMSKAAGPVINQLGQAASSGAMPAQPPAPGGA